MLIKCTDLATSSRTFSTEMLSPSELSYVIRAEEKVPCSENQGKDQTQGKGSTQGYSDKKMAHKAKRDSTTQDLKTICGKGKAG